MKILFFLMSGLTLLLQSGRANPNKNLGYLFAAYMVIWLLILGYLVTLGRRQKRLDAEIEILKQMRDES